MSRPVSRNSTAFTYLKNYKIGKKEKGKIVTHRALSGGNFSVPYDNFLELLSKLELDWRNGRRNYLVEQKTPIFKFMLDLDFTAGEPIEQEYWLEMVHHIQWVLQEFGAKEHVCYVANADPVQLESKQWKNGCHLYWPSMLVDQKAALLIRWAIVEHFKEVYPQYKDKWEEIVDDSVLKANGIRYLFSNKAIQCPVCKNKDEADKKTCGPCDGAWYMDIGRPYTPRCVVDAAGNVDATESRMFTTNLRYALEMTSCVSSALTMPTVYRAPDWLREQPAPPVVATSSNNQRTKLAVAINGSTGFTKKLDGREVIFERYECKSIQDAIVSFLNEGCTLSGAPTYRQNIQKLLKATTGAAYMVVGTNKYCNNVRKCHNGQDVYYIIKQNGIMQFCWSNKHCKAYMSPLAPITATLCHILFSDELQSDGSALAAGALQRWASHRAIDRRTQSWQDTYTRARSLFPLLQLNNTDPLLDIAMHFEMDPDGSVNAATFGFPMIE